MAMAHAEADAVEAEKGFKKVEGRRGKPVKGGSAPTPMPMAPLTPCASVPNAEARTMQSRQLIATMTGMKVPGSESGDSATPGSVAPTHDDGGVGAAPANAPAAAPEALASVAEPDVSGGGGGGGGGVAPIPGDIPTLPGQTEVPESSFNSIQRLNKILYEIKETAAALVQFGCVVIEPGTALPRESILKMFMDEHKMPIVENMTTYEMARAIRHKIGGATPAHFNAFASP